MVGHHRGLHRGLGRRDQLLPHQQHLGGLGGLFLCQHGPLERVARGSPDAVPGLLRPVALLPPVVVLGRRGAAARAWREDATDLDPRCRMGTGRGRSARVLGRDRRRKPDKGQGRGNLQAVQRRHGKGRASLPLYLTARDIDTGGGRAPAPSPTSPNGATKCPPSPSTPSGPWPEPARSTPCSPAPSTCRAASSASAFMSPISSTAATSRRIAATTCSPPTSKWPRPT